RNGAWDNARQTSRGRCPCRSRDPAPTRPDRARPRAGTLRAPSRARDSRRSALRRRRQRRRSRRPSSGDRSRPRATWSRAYHTRVSYTRYGIVAEPVPAAQGWDAWAEEYATLNANPTYALGKELLHAQVN